MVDNFPKTGVLLINLGTPEAPTVSAVRRYLKEFLSDPYVIDLPYLWRKLLLYGFILPFRSKKSAKLYQSIWSAQGSPLRVYSEALRKALAEELGSKFFVVLGMRYGEPSLESGVKALLQQRCKRLIVFPLFPQYSRAATETALQKVREILDRQAGKVLIRTKRDFFDDPRYIESLSALIRENLTGFRPDHLFFSYHGLPERHLDKALCFAANCDRLSDCPASTSNRNCYRAQCFTTSRALAHRLGLSRADYSVGFQSRLGRTPWIRPYTDQQLVQLAERGIKHLAIACPSFVVDCLETLEEIGIRAHAQWRSLGGETLKLIPALNTEPLWVKALAAMIVELS